VVDKWPVIPASCTSNSQRPFPCPPARPWRARASLFAASSPPPEELPDEKPGRPPFRQRARPADGRSTRRLRSENDRDICGPTRGLRWPIRLAAAGVAHTGSRPSCSFLGKPHSPWLTDLDFTPRFAPAHRLNSRVAWDRRAAPGGCSLRRRLLVPAVEHMCRGRRPSEG